MKNRRIALFAGLFVLLVVVIVVEAVVLSKLNGRDKTPAAVPTVPAISQVYTAPPTAEPTQIPIYTPIPTSVPTQAPTDPPATQPPATQAPTPAPTPKPTDPPGAAVDSGSFRSDTGSYLNLAVSWTAYDVGDGNVKLNVKGSLDSYSLSVGARWPGITISFNGQSYTCNTDSVTVGDGHAVTPLFDTTFTVPKGVSDTMTVSYDYRGSYSGIDLPTIDCSGSVSTG